MVEHPKIDGFELWYWRRLLSPLDCKEIKPVIPMENQPWIFTGRTNAEAKAPILWPSDEKSQLMGKKKKKKKKPDSVKDWRQKKGEAEDEMVI